MKLRLASLSDIHGNDTALEAVLRDIKKKGVDYIFVIGDLVDLGPHNREVLDMIRGLKECFVLKGNHDELVVECANNSSYKPASFVEEIAVWTAKNLDRSSIDYLEALPGEFEQQFGNVLFHALHGHIGKSGEEIAFTVSIQEFSGLASAWQGDIVVVGHTHTPYILDLDGKLVVNDGSVGVPLDRDTRAAYAFIEIGEGLPRAEIVRVEYDMERAVKALYESGIPNPSSFERVLRRARL